jgi:GH25 family lysozyme M1 (1,4-beta-N-acetylmuramidase)
MTLFGWDMSHYDASGIGTAVREGISFITHKAGGDSNDQELAPWWSGVRSLPESVVLGAYWVLYPGSPEARADAFLSRLDSQCPGWRDRDAFILQVDCEKWGGNPNTVPSKADVMRFCNRLVARTSADYWPIVYGPKWVYEDGLAGLGYPLWASAYVSGTGGFKALYPGDGSSKWAAYSGQVPAILQYSSGATIGGQTKSDANAFRGTIQELKALVAPGKDTMPTADEILDRLNERLRKDDDPLARALRAAPWQYTGGGLQGASSALDALADTQVLQSAVNALTALVVQQSAASAQDIAEALAPLIKLPEGSTLSSEELVTAVKQALREGTGTP